MKKKVSITQGINAFSKMRKIKSEKENVNLLERAFHNDEKMAFPETLMVLNSLSKKYKMLLLTNTTYYSFNKLNKKYPLNKYFDIILPSYETGLLKPDEKFFRLALKRMKLKPSEVLMVGDSLQSDYEPALKLGINALLIDRNDIHPKINNRIRSLTEIKKYLMQKEK